MIEKLSDAEFLRRWHWAAPVTKYQGIPWLTDQEMLDCYHREGEEGVKALLKLWEMREKRVRKAINDPYNFAMELACWARADRFLTPKEGDEWAHRTRLLLVLGGNRSSKSQWAADRVVRTLVKYPGTRIVAICQKMETSRQVMQDYIWSELPKEIKALNKKRDPRNIYHVHRSKATGFGDPPRIVFPAHGERASELIFLTYTQDPADYEGIQLGNPWVPGVLGYWADESLPLPWLTLLRYRSVTCDAKGIWTFTVLRGMTQTLDDALGAGKVVETRPAELLADRQNLPDIPKGHMPTVQHGAAPETAVVYFHTDENPFAGYERLKRELAGRSVETIERRAYGFPRAVRGRRFRNFGAWNMVKPEDVPLEGTNYLHVDPADARNWFMVWLRVTPTGHIYAWAEWPSVGELGEWAVATERNPDEGGSGWDGDPGPAQETLGYGVARYKRLMLNIEEEEWKRMGSAGTFGNAGTFGTGPARAGAGGARQPYVYRRTVDRRFGPSPITLPGGLTTLAEVTSLWQQLNEEQPGAPALPFDLASGAGLEEDGAEMIQGALDFDRERAIDPILNCPRLFVSERCSNLAWALANYTGRDGQKGACKDPIDCLRDSFTSGLEYIPPLSRQVVRAQAVYA